jgi:hypothetical protein
MLPVKEAAEVRGASKTFRVRLSRSEAVDMVLSIVNSSLTQSERTARKEREIAGLSRCGAFVGRAGGHKNSLGAFKDAYAGMSKRKAMMAFATDRMF